MGKRKSSRKIVKKEKPKLDTTFDCLFCNHEKSIIVSMDKDRKVGNLKCKVCSASYQAAIHHLSDPIDVYSEWIDACE
ncbi:Elf1-domain-containing protein, partial [Martensiomyces pterosporus]